MKIADFAEIADAFYDTDFISGAAQFFCYLEFIENLWCSIVLEM